MPMPVPHRTFRSPVPSTTSATFSPFLIRGHANSCPLSLAQLLPQTVNCGSAKHHRAMARRAACAAIALLLASLPPPPSARAACAGEAFSANRVFAACTDLPSLGASLHWTHDAPSGSLSLAFVARPASPGGWVAWGINPTGQGMPGTQALVAAPYYGAAWSVQTYSISGYALGDPGPIAFPASDLAAELGADGRVTVFARLSLGPGAGMLNHVWQVGADVYGGRPAPHAMGGDNLAAKGRLDLLRATATASDDAAGSATQKRNVSCYLSHQFLLSSMNQPH